MPDANGQYTESDVLFDIRYESLRAGGGVLIQAQLNGLVATEMISNYQMCAAASDGVSLGEMMTHAKRRLARCLIDEVRRIPQAGPSLTHRNMPPLRWGDWYRQSHGYGIGHPAASASDTEWRVVDMPPTPVSTMEYRMEHDPKYREFCEWDQEECE